MKKSKLAAAVRSANGRERLTAVPDRNLVRALGASGYVVAYDSTEPDPCPHEDYTAPT
jgi:hypothetical protein